MKREVKIGLMFLVFGGLVALNFYLFKKGLNNYLIVTLTLAIVSLIALILYIKNTRSADAIYRSQFKNILKSYDAILISSANLPKLTDRNIIKVTSIEELVDAQMEIRKPIYYKLEEKYCSFVLLDQSEACFFVLKESEDLVTPLDLVLEAYENDGVSVPVVKQEEKVEDVIHEVKNIENNIVENDDNKNEKIEKNVEMNSDEVLFDETSVLGIDSILDYSNKMNVNDIETL